MVDTNEVKPSTANPQRVGTWPLVWLLDQVESPRGIIVCFLSPSYRRLHNALPRSHGAAIQRRRVHQRTTWFPSLDAVDPLVAPSCSLTRVHIKHWNAVAQWRWNTACTTTLMSGSDSRPVLRMQTRSLYYYMNIHINVSIASATLVSVRGILTDAR